MSDNFDQSLGSISVSISKGSVYESDGLSMYDAALEDALGREEKSISNESIQKGDILLETYTVEADAISGGMGSVWRVHHQSWNTDLAMKRPQPRFFAEGSKKRKENFIKECEAWINLGLHPNIVSCYYVREIGGVPTIFSEWMDNGSLKDRIRDGSLYEGTEAEQVERLLDLAIQFARGLSYSHENGLIHRDVKPDNLLLTKEWDAKVADFGLAKARDEAISEDGAAQNGGYTPEYCSSEQMAGHDADARTDIYSWALSVLEMYTKGRAWESGPVVSEYREQYIDVVKLPLPKGLRGLLYRCLEADADNRPGDFKELEATLHKIYKTETDGEYPRPAPKAAVDTADSQNNRALSMLDLGKPEEAEKLWESALKTDYSNFRCHYNYAFSLWNQRKIDDMEFHARIQAQRESTALWAKAMATVSMIRRDDDREATECVELLASLDADSPALPELRRLLKLQNSIDQQRVKEPNLSAIHLVSPPQPLESLFNQTIMQSVKAKRSPDGCFYLTEDGACLDAKTRRELWRFPDYEPTGLSNFSICSQYFSYGSLAVIQQGNRFSIVECATGQIRYQVDGNMNHKIDFSRDDRKAVFTGPDSKFFEVLNLVEGSTAQFSFSGSYLGEARFVDLNGHVVACTGEAVHFFDAESGRSLLTIASERDYEDDIYFDTIMAFTEGGLALVKSSRREVWVRIPNAAYRPSYELSFISSHHERSSALRKAEQNYAAAKECFDQGNIIGAFHLLDQSRADATLQLHPASLALWTKLGAYFKRSKLITVLPTNDDPATLPVRGELIALTTPERKLYATEGPNVLHVHTKTKMTWAQDTYWDLDYSYSLSVYNSVSDELYFEISNLTTDSCTDKESHDAGLHVELEQNGTLRYGKNTWSNTVTINLCDPQIQIDRGLSIALPGGYRMCNRKDGVDIGGFRFLDEFYGLQPLWNADIIVCRSHNYRLVYQYVDPERE